MHTLKYLDLENTNKRISQHRTQKTVVREYMGSTDLVELKAYIGLVYYRGLMGLTKHSVRHLWGKEAPIVFAATMSQNRFNFLNSKLSFDDKLTREERWKADRGVFERFNLLNQKG